MFYSIQEHVLPHILPQMQFHSCSKLSTQFLIIPVSFNLADCPMVDKDIYGGDFEILNGVDTWDACGKFL